MSIAQRAKASSSDDDCGPPTPTPTTRPTDPNELLGPGGHGAQNFVAVGSLLPYRINFENETNATAPAQFVTVQNVLATGLDPATFELASIGFGDRFFAIPPGSQHYERTETLTLNGYRFQVQIEAGLNLATRTAYSTFSSLNVTNGLPPPVEIGFLPPENGTGRGQGHLAYTIRPNSGLATGAEIRNVATIKFDQNSSIATDLRDPHDLNSGHDPNKQALVTIDADLPTSSIVPLPQTSASPFLVSWAGNDLGAGIASYDVYVSTNQADWSLWLANTQTASALFTGDQGVTYFFYSVAHDGAGNVQPTPTTPDAATTVNGFSNRPPYFLQIAAQTTPELVLFSIPVTAADPDSATVLTYGLVSAPQGVGINPETGILSWIPSESQGPSTNTITVKVTDSGSPPLSATNGFTVVVQEVNSPPVLILPPDQFTHAGLTLVVTNSATDPDWPPNELNFGLVSGPQGMRLDPATGVLTWTPAAAQAPSVNLISVSVTDNNPWAVNEPHMSVTNSFKVVVQKFEVTATYSNGQLALQFDTVIGRQYRVEYRDDLGAGSWQPVPGNENLTGSGSVMAVTLDVGAGSQRFYRLVEQLQ